MRIALELMLDRRQDCPDADPTILADQVRDTYLPSPGTTIFVPTDDDEVSEYTVTSTGAWHEDMRPEMTHDEMRGDPTTATTTDSRAYRGAHAASDR